MQQKVCKQTKERWGIAKVMIGARESKGIYDLYWLNENRNITIKLVYKRFVDRYMVCYE